MPDVQYTINGQHSKGAFSQAFAASGITASMATSGVMAVTLDLSATPSTISTANMNQLGICFARSLATEATHTVSFGRYDGTVLHDSVTLRAGEAAVLRLSAGNYAAKSVVSGSRLWITIYEG